MISKTLPTIFILSLFLTACSHKYLQYTSDYTFSSPDGTPDYSKLNYWAAHPSKWDPSDSVPKPLQSDYHTDTSADVFFIHPTTYTDPTRKLGWNGPVDNPELNAKTDYTTILFQASIFNAAGKIYAPRYRQANLRCYYPKTKEDTLKSIAAFEMAYADVKAAFSYYLQHENHGRPIIIASHSQGTNHAERLLKEFFDGKELSKQLVVAYLVGMPLKPGYFQNLPVCDSPAQTGCVCSWRTFKDGYQPDYVKKETFVSVVTNPLSWDTHVPVLPRSANPGGILLKFNKLYPRVTDAEIKDGVLWAKKPHFFGNIFLTNKNYHIADMNLYYLSIRENVARRLDAFTKK